MEKKYNLKNFLQVKLLLIISIFGVYLSGCNDSPTINNIDSLNANFAVISDAHYFSPELGNSGLAFEKYLESDRKMIAESKAISEAAVDALLKENIKFVIVSGDLTKDGEKQSHIELSKLYGKLISAGIKVIVVPGNHDVMNPHSKKYIGDSELDVESVNPDEFAEIYKDCGFATAIARDDNSLSYISEPVHGLWVFALDDCKYKENADSPITSGTYSEATLKWIKDNLQKAKANNKTVIAVQHHGLVEHFAGQSQNPISKDYVIDNWKEVADQFIKGGVKAIFTGHFHSNDVTKYSNSEGEIYDIETGSLVTTPCPYRLVSISENSININTKHINNINFDTKGVDFQTYAFNFIKNNLNYDVISLAMESYFNIDKETSELASPVIIQAILAHYKGDEVMPLEAKEKLEMIKKINGIGAQLIAFFLNSLYTDLPPGDNNLSIKLIKSNSSIAKN